MGRNRLNETTILFASSQRRAQQPTGIAPYE